MGNVVKFMIWFIDYTVYEKEIDNELKKRREDYFAIKTYNRAKIIGETAPVKIQTFGTGLLRLATIISRNGYDVLYFSYDELQSRIENCVVSPEIVVFSAVTPTIPKCARLVKIIKENFPNALVKIGGVHVTYNEVETKKRYPMFDQFITGYEKDASEKIVGKKLNNVDDIYVDYSILPKPLKEYAINTFTTLGCPFSCRYCVDRLAPRFLAQPDGNISVLKKLLPDKTLVHFFDSVLGFSAEGIVSVCEKLQSAEHNFILSCDMRADMLNPQLLDCLMKAGFKEIRLGVESADEELLLKNNRTLSFEKFQNQIKMIRENSNLYLTLYSITGLVGTSFKSQELTLEYFDRLLTDKMVNEIKNALYVPYPMNNLDYEKQGVFITDDNWENYDRQSYPVYRTENLSNEEIWQLYLLTAKSINNSWLKQIGFSKIEDIPNLNIPYSEYLHKSYLGKK